MNGGKTRGRGVLMAGPYPPPEGGWATAIREEREALERRGIAVEVLDLGPNRRAGGPGATPVRGALDLVAKLLRGGARGDLFRLHMNGDSPKGIAIVLFGEAASLLGGRRAVLSFHAGVAQRYFPDRGRPHLGLLWRIVFGLAGTVVCDCEAVRGRIARYRAARDVFAISPFTPERVRYAPARLPEAIERFAAARRPLLFTYVACRPEYELEGFVEALATVRRAFPEIGCVVVDDRSFPDAGVERRVREAIEANGLGSALAFTGHLSRDAFLTALSRSDLFVRTPVTDGVASCVLEALHLGVPVLAVENACRPAGTITYAPASPDDLAAKLADAAGRVEELKRSVRAGGPIEDGAERLAALLRERCLRR